MESKWEPEIVEILKNTGKKGSRNRCGKRVLNGTAKKPFGYRPGSARVLISGPAGEGFREGVGWFSIVPDGTHVI